MRILGLKGVTGFLPLRDKQTDMIVPNRLVARFFVPDLLTALSYVMSGSPLGTKETRIYDGSSFFVSLWRQVVDCE